MAVKFRGVNFADGQSLLFCGVNFHRFVVNLRLIFMDVCTHAHYVRYKVVSMDTEYASSLTS